MGDFAPEMATPVAFLRQALQPCSTFRDNALDRWGRGRAGAGHVRSRYRKSRL